MNSYGDSIYPLDVNNGEPKLFELNPATLEYILGVDTQPIGELWRKSSFYDTMFLVRLDSGVPGMDFGQIGDIFIGCRSSIDDLLSELRSQCYNESFSIHENYIDILSGKVKGIHQAIIDKNEYKLLFDEIAYKSDVH
ncbi:MAG: hypothetical protein GY820_04800 [Gammaproteobacteria bacterium]|nr:hypothetical protein [Gammaproteobacteria bacterium]